MSSPFPRRSRLRRLVVGAALIAALALGGASANAALSPPASTLTVAAGSSATEAKTIGVPAVPPVADIEIAIDTTGSMFPSIAQAQADATALVSAVQASIPGAQFAVVQFKDAADLPEYQVVQALTGNPAAIQSAVNGLSATGGGDAPEAYNVVFRNSHTPATGGDIGWRAGSRKFVVVIGDAEPHGAGTAGLPGCSDATLDPNGLSTPTELASMAAANRTLFMIRQTATASTSLGCYQSLAAGAFGGGAAVNGGTSLGGQIVALINAATASVADVHLEVASASPAPAATSWISFAPPAAGPVTPPATVAVNLTVSVPAGTPAGTYMFDIVALADGADIGQQALTLVVGGPPPPPKRPPHCPARTVSKKASPVTDLHKPKCRHVVKSGVAKGKKDSPAVD